MISITFHRHGQRDWRDKKILMHPLIHLLILLSTDLVQPFVRLKRIYQFITNLLFTFLLLYKSVSTYYLSSCYFINLYQLTLYSYCFINCCQFTIYLLLIYKYFLFILLLITNTKFIFLFLYKSVLTLYLAFC